MSVNCRLRPNLFGYWIVCFAGDHRIAWSGSNWVRVTDEGGPAEDVQVSNFKTKDEAVQYARSFGFNVVNADA